MTGPEAFLPEQSGDRDGDHGTSNLGGAIVKAHQTRRVTSWLVAIAASVVVVSAYAQTPAPSPSPGMAPASAVADPGGAGLHEGRARSRSMRGSSNQSPTATPAE